MRSFFCRSPPDGSEDRERRFRERLDRLESERARLAEGTESLLEGLVFLDDDGCVVGANAAFRKLFDVEGAVDGKPLREIAADKRLEHAIGKAKTSGTVQTIEIERPLDSSAIAQTPRHLTCACTLLTAGGMAITIRDVSDSLLLDQSRRDLVANLSHEIKTPLTAIRGFAETLRDGALDDPTTARRFTAQIVQQCDRLHSLLSDILTLARVERHQAVETRQPVELGDIIRDAVETLQPIADEGRVELTMSLEPAATLQGDPRTLSELCNNLLDNAVKYNREGGRVDIRVVKLEGQLLLEVTDTGMGIPEKSVGRIFERFYRVDRGRSRAEGGTGLGLSIAKHAAEAHGGWIEVETELGKGSRFRVYLPTNPAVMAG